ncbi:transformer-SR ribonucleoprotein [Colletotrichum costaricense]|uniref:Transformer-SR ribonucleoprotein n=2 Tax=Colletotrichum acutatum species complex TaxID=2707335 RepID=A0AAI9YWZ4_9PEZI|nr:transformer-SR ribonucleoprotein [Colletotrichum costaricense]XP_060385341.1 transformer-SR ribonucleoprotein [Colletotrichum tamarilloi]KAI3543953.1 transformer-SR ribonucleoprotein [Colletotrichum filicis]KAK1504583.1 transformer-SR ribonucleoprotein [Colletotrichum tamarilloi]KAK1526218.1 transformer-SR ribonucleoprotein [Colletotrichum costaricense]
MASTAMDYEAANGDRYDGSFFLDTDRPPKHDEALTDKRDTDEAPRYERDNRSASPRPARDDGDSGRRRSASPSGNGDRDRDRGAKDETGSRGGDRDDDGAINPGSNLFVTGIHPRLTEQEVTRMFEKYGDVEKCQIMRDPHTKESRGFGFVKMVTSDQADAAKEGLQGEQIEGRTLSIEKARRARPRTPTPGKYFGPPKRAVTVLLAMLPPEVRLTLTPLPAPRVALANFLTLSSGVVNTPGLMATDGSSLSSFLVRSITADIPKFASHEVLVHYN